MLSYFLFCFFDWFLLLFLGAVCLFVLFFPVGSVPGLLCCGILPHVHSVEMPSGVLLSYCFQTVGSFQNANWCPKILSRMKQTRLVLVLFVLPVFFRILSWIQILWNLRLWSFCIRHMWCLKEAWSYFICFYLFSPWYSVCLLNSLLSLKNKTCRELQNCSCLDGYSRPCILICPFFKKDRRHWWHKVQYKVINGALQN